MADTMAFGENQGKQIPPVLLKEMFSKLSFSPNYFNEAIPKSRDTIGISFRISVSSNRMGTRRAKALFHLCGQGGRPGQKT
jgi:hypothetical protein